MTLVAGVDSSTQSCKLVICDADSGALVRQAAAPHPPGTQVAPEAWWSALTACIEAVGGLNDVSAISICGQQHGMVCLDDGGYVVRDALLWNDTRSAASAHDLVAELPGGAGAWASAVGSVPLASFTITKLRWLAENEPANAAATAAVCLPHDWLTWRLAEDLRLDALTTDRSDASGTGYWSPVENRYRDDLLAMAFGSVPITPRVLGPHESCATSRSGAVIGPGVGDNASSALGLGMQAGDVVVSIGTSGVVCAVSSTPVADALGLVAGFADATGRYLPLACTLNGAPALGTVARMLGVDLDQLAALALSAPPGAEGVVLVPYFDGERTPDRPNSTAALHGLTSANTTPANIARAAFEGMLCCLSVCLDALVSHGVQADRVIMIGGAARSAALRQIAPTIFATPIVVPSPAEYAAIGAARQAAWTLTAAPEPPTWPTAVECTSEAAEIGFIRDRYRDVWDLTAARVD